MLRDRVSRNRVYRSYISNRLAGSGCFLARSWYFLSTFLTTAPYQVIRSNILHWATARIFYFSQYPTGNLIDVSAMFYRIHNMHLHIVPNSLLFSNLGIQRLIALEACAPGDTGLNAWGIGLLMSPYIKRSLRISSSQRSLFVVCRYAFLYLLSLLSSYIANTIIFFPHFLAVTLTNTSLSGGSSPSSHFGPFVQQDSSTFTIPAYQVPYNWSRTPTPIVGQRGLVTQ